MLDQEVPVGPINAQIEGLKLCIAVEERTFAGDHEILKEQHISEVKLATGAVETRARAHDNVKAALGLEITFVPTNDNEEATALGSH